MNWAEFLADIEVADYFHGHPDGEHLFKKVLHDVRHCLSIHLGIAELIVAMEKGLPVEALRSLGTWSSVVTTWVVQLSRFSEYIGLYERISPEWAKPIVSISEIIDVTVLQAEIDSIAGSNQQDVRKLVRGLKRNADELGLLLQDIRSQNYKRLLLTLRYRDVLETDSLAH